jgi:hypothetical protein
METVTQLRGANPRLPLRRNWPVGKTLVAPIGGDFLFGHGGFLDE